MQTTLWQQCWQLTKPFWTAQQNRRIWFFAVIACLCIILYSAASVWLTDWQKGLLDALQQHELTSLKQRCLRLLGIVGLLCISHGYAQYITSLIGLHWRRWLTHHYIKHWVHHLHTPTTSTINADNPDQRLSQDVHEFPEQTMLLLHGLVSSLLLLGSFSWLLWHLSGTAPIILSNTMTFYIPGYLFWAALLWAILCSWVTVKIANPLVHLDYQQERYNADYRRALLLMHEQNQLNGTIVDDKQKSTLSLRNLFKPIVRNYQHSLHIHRRYAFFKTFFLSGTTLVGMIIGLPLFVQQHIQLGGLTQIGLAFSEVSMALSFIVIRYTDIAQWQAVVKRLYEFTTNLQKVTNTESHI